jgi:hypothetical protein
MTGDDARPPVLLCLVRECRGHALRPFGHCLFHSMRPDLVPITTPAVTREQLARLPWEDDYRRNVVP